MTDLTLSRIVARVQTNKTVNSVNKIWCLKYLLGIALCLLSLIGTAAELNGLVISVSDGDTIKILDDNQHMHTVRLVGIDAPEKNQAFGQSSKQSLSGLIYKHRVSVEWPKRDKYGRIVGKVLAENGLDLCLEQIILGMAWHYKKYANEQSADDRVRYAEAEKNARESMAGLWQDDSPVPPWEWRHSRAK